MDEWPSFIDPSVDPTKITVDVTLHDTLLFPSPTESSRPLPSDLQRAAVINSLAFSSSFPESLREHLLVQWSEETLMPDRASPLIDLIKENYTPETQSVLQANNHLDHHDSQSTSFRSLEENHPNYIHARKKSLARQLERSPSPVTQINHLRKVLAGGLPRPQNLPKIEVNGEKVQTPSELDLTAEDEKNGDTGDVTMILKSLNVNGEWNEKPIETCKENEETIRPPYGI